jgi:hypothetical protein
MKLSIKIVGRQELVIFHLLVVIMLEGTWHLCWMLHDLNILLIGFLSHFFGKQWVMLMKQPDNKEGRLSCMFSLVKFIISPKHNDIRLY